MIDRRRSLVAPCSFGKYELLERIGSGGMAEIYRARLPGVAGFEKIVVIKRLHPHLLDRPEMVAMFVDEAKLAAQVQHKNVVEVFELDQLPNGEFYMVLEYVRGTDLKHLLHHARRSLKRVSPWLSVYAAIEVLDALAFAHSLVDGEGRRRNIVHRDVSPDNIFVSEQGDIKLGDFGVARDDTRLEQQSGQIKGKVSYMAPEQLAGRAIDQRYDVFALGVVLWECLTQRSLFLGETAAETISLVCQGPRPPPSQFAQNIPRELDVCVLLALEHDPMRRFASTREMQAMLIDILPRLRKNVGPVEVREEIAWLLGEEVTTPAFEIPSLRKTQDSEPLEITDDLIVEEAVDPTPGDAVKTLEDAINPNSWDGTYAIINPRLRPDRPIQPKAPTMETDDLIARHLVYEIPMPGGPGVLETGDIVKNKTKPAGPMAGEISFDDPVPWNGTVPPTPTPTSGARVWEPHQGPHPFWMRSLRQQGFGPCSLDELLTMIRARVPEAARRTVEISADGASWMPLSRFIELAHLHGAERGDLPEGGVRGVLEHHAIVQLLGRIARERPTGRLIVRREGASGSDTLEIHMVDGAPTTVATSDPRLDTPRQIIGQKVLEQPMLEACMHILVREGRSIDEIVFAMHGIDLAQSRTRFMLARLEPMMAWESAIYAFAPLAPIDVEPFAQSPIAILPSLIHRTKSVEQLRALLGDALDKPYDRAERFDDVVRMLALSAAQFAGINPMGQTRTLEEAVRCSLGGEKFGLTMAYILLNLGLLQPRVRSYSSTPPYHR